MGELGVSQRQDMNRVRPLENLRYFGKFRLSSHHRSHRGLDTSYIPNIIPLTRYFILLRLHQQTLG